MARWSTWRRAGLFSLPALATGLMMEMWETSFLAWVFVTLAIIAAGLIGGISSLNRSMSPAGTTRSRHPLSIYTTVIASYALIGGLLGSWWVEYRLTSLCKHFQHQLRSLPIEAGVESLSLPSIHRLIFHHVAASAEASDGKRPITIFILDPRGRLFSGYFVTADEIRHFND